MMMTMMTYRFNMAEKLIRITLNMTSWQYGDGSSITKTMTESEWIKLLGKEEWMKLNKAQHPTR